MAKSAVKLLPSSNRARTKVETVELTPALVATWSPPPFQRPLKVTTKLMEVVATIKDDGGVIPGILTLGRVDGDKSTYLLDGQHRTEAFKLSELEVGYADVRTMFFTDMAAMGEEFVQLNSSIVRFKPDDVLRGLEKSSEALTHLRSECRFVGYDQIRRGPSSPLLSMSMLLRCWFGSAPDTPVSSTGSAATLARSATLEDVKLLVVFLGAAYRAWGPDAEYVRLWNGLNLTLCMWLYRRLVVSPWSVRTKPLTVDQFSKCLMSLSADSDYLAWLVGRHTGEHDRSPAYNRIKSLFAKRVELDTGKKPLMPKPPWFVGGGH